VFFVVIVLTTKDTKNTKMTRAMLAARNFMTTLPESSKAPIPQLLESFLGRFRLTSRQLTCFH
jgi:hypothetical protein